MLGWSDQEVTLIAEDFYALPSPEHWFVQRVGDAWMAGHDDGWVTDEGDRYNQRRKTWPTAEAAITSIIGPPQVTS